MNIQSLKKYKKPDHRRTRMEHMIQKVISELLHRGRIKDRALTDAPITVTHVHCSEDLKYADVYVSELGTRVPDVRERNYLMAGFKRAQSYITAEVNQHLNRYRGPELRFKIDNQLYDAERIVDLISKTCKPPETADQFPEMS